MRKFSHPGGICLVGNGGKARLTRQNHGVIRQHFAEFFFCLFDLIQTKRGQYNGFLYIPVRHLKPQHAAQNAVRPLLVQFICVPDFLPSHIP